MPTSIDHALEVVQGIEAILDEVYADRPKPISIPFLTEHGKRLAARPPSPADLNAALFERLAGAESPELTDAVNEFTRARMREDGFLRRVLPPLEMNNDELDRSV